MCVLLLNFYKWSRSVRNRFSSHLFVASSCSSCLSLLCSIPSAHYTSSPLLPPVDGQLGYAQLWSTTNNAAVNIPVPRHKCLQGPGLSLSLPTSGWKIKCIGERTVSRTLALALQATSHFWLSICFLVCKMAERVDLFISKRPSSA